MNIIATWELQKPIRIYTFFNNYSIELDVFSNARLTRKKIKLKNCPKDCQKYFNQVYKQCEYKKISENNENYNSNLNFKNNYSQFLYFDDRVYFRNMSDVLDNRNSYFRNLIGNKNV